MVRKRHTPEQMINKLREAEVATADLAHLATALKDASAARFAALADTD